MRRVRLIVLLSLSIPAFIVFIVGVYDFERRITTMGLPRAMEKQGECYLQVNCSDALELINPPFLALLIDEELIKGLCRNECAATHGRIRLAVDVQLVNSVRQENYPEYEIVYYEDFANKDYLRFYDLSMRIIPRVPVCVRGNLSIPQDTKRFLEFWKRSKLLQCRGLKVQRKPTARSLPLQRTLQAMSSFMSYLTEFDIYPFLCGGSLLVLDLEDCLAIDDLDRAVQQGMGVTLISEGIVQALYCQYEEFSMLLKYQPSPPPHSAALEKPWSQKGWYRECDVIPHTLDIDFAALTEEHNPDLLKHLLSNETKFRLTRVLGRVNDSYEFTVQPLSGGRPDIDLFWMYSSQNESWVGGTSSDGTKFKYTYPRYNETCAADLHGHIFWITCNPETTLVMEYGPKWYIDHPTSRFSWSSSHFNVRRNGKWTKAEMKSVYRVYNRKLLKRLLHGR